MERARIRVGGRRSARMALGAAVLLAAACSTNREITEPEPMEVTEERVAEALIDEGDLTSGFTPAEQAEGFATEVLPEHACDDALGELEPEVEASRTFTDGTTTLTHVIGWFPGQGGAAEQVFRNVAAECAEVVATDAGVSIRAGHLDFGVLSDDTLPYAFEVEPTTGPIEERDLVIVRRGDLVSVIRVEGLRPSDKQLIDGAARVAIGYVGLLHDDTT